MSAEPPDLGDLLRQAQELGSQLAEAQARADSQEVEGRSGGGAVRIKVSGSLEFRAVAIDPAVLEGGDVAMLEDLVLAALRDAVTQVHQVRGKALGGVAPGLLGSIPGTGLPGLPEQPTDPGRPGD